LSLPQAVQGSTAFLALVVVIDGIAEVSVAACQELRFGVHPNIPAFPSMSSSGQKFVMLD
jgi:hypothetical protein